MKMRLIHNIDPQYIMMSLREILESHKFSICP